MSLPDKLTDAPRAAIAALIDKFKADATKVERVKDGYRIETVFDGFPWIGTAHDIVIRINTPTGLDRHARCEIGLNVWNDTIICPVILKLNTVYGVRPRVKPTDTTFADLPDEEDLAFVVGAFRSAFPGLAIRDKRTRPHVITA